MAAPMPESRDSTVKILISMKNSLNKTNLFPLYSLFFGETRGKYKKLPVFSDLTGAGSRWLLLTHAVFFGII
jgi:hypothetical protein